MIFYYKIELIVVHAQLNVIFSLIGTPIYHCNNFLSKYI